MKKTYTFILTFFIALAAFSQTQIENSDLEDWAIVDYESTSYQEPIPWTVGNICASFGGTAQCQVAGFKTTDAARGSFAMQVFSSGFGLGGILDYPFTDAPTSFEIMLKADIAQNEAASVLVILHNTPIFETEEADYAGIGEITVASSSSTFSKYQGNILYTGAGYQYISIVVMVDSEDPETPSSVTFDDFNLVYNITGRNEANDDDLFLSSTLITNSLDFAEEISSFELLNLHGTIVLKGNQQNNSVAGVSEGMYILKAVTRSGEIKTYRVIKR